GRTPRPCSPRTRCPATGRPSRTCPAPRRPGWPSTCYRATTPRRSGTPRPAAPDSALNAAGRDRPRGPARGLSTWCEPPGSPAGCSDPVEQVEEPLGQRLVALGGAAVDPAERGEHQGGRVELQHGRQVADIARLVGHPPVGDADPVAARVAPGDGDADR